LIHFRVRSSWYLVSYWWLALVLIYCSGIACRPKPPAILVFNAAPNEITVGESTTLRWSIEGATAVSIDQGIGDVAATGLTKLSPNKTVAYTLTATNAGGTVSKSVVISVGAAPPPTPDTKAPVITNVSAAHESETRTLITWVTNEPSTGQVEYGETTDYGFVVTSNEDMTTTHTIILTGLEPNTTYHYRVKSKDKAGNEALSVGYAFITPMPKSPYVLELQSSEWGRSTEDDFGFGVEPVSLRKFLFIKGSARNNSRSNLRGVVCTMECWRGNTLVKSEVYVHRGPAMPGQVFNFYIKTADDPSIDKVTIEFADSLGQEIQVIEK
jgi:hypothetical protein